MQYTITVTVVLSTDSVVTVVSVVVIVTAGGDGVIVLDIPSFAYDIVEDGASAVRSYVALLTI